MPALKSGRCERLTLSYLGKRGWYSNVGYKALGFLLEAVTGKPYAKIVQERILDPLGMTRSVATITLMMRGADSRSATCLTTTTVPGGLPTG